jgi:class 3 adenylate cyclase
MAQHEHDAVPTGFDQQLRRLRFTEPGLERSFQDDFARRRLGQFRVALWVGIAIQVLVTYRFYVVEDFPLTVRGQVLRVLVAIGLPVLGMRLTRSQHATRLAPRFMLFYSLVIGLFLVRTWAPTTTGWTFLTTYLIAACIMNRLSFRQAVVVQASLISWFAVYSQLVIDRPPPSPARGLSSLGFEATFILVAVYLLEHAARRDFVLGRLLDQEREKSERLLLNVLPSPIAQRLKENPGTIADGFAEATVLFADLADSTPHIAGLPPESAVELLNDVFTCFDRLADEHGLEKIKTIGDAYMVAGGLPEPRDDHAEAVVAMALAMQREVGRFHWPDGEGLRLRIGINTGPVVAGVIGTRKFVYDLWGDTVNVASRMESHGTVGEIQLTRSTYERVRHLHRGKRRTVEVKGKGRMTVYVLTGVPVGAKAQTVRDEVLA